MYTWIVYSKYAHVLQRAKYARMPPNNSSALSFLSLPSDRWLSSCSPIHNEHVLSRGDELDH